MQGNHRPSLYLAALVVFSLCVNLIWYSQIGLIRDDAYITFQYARNIANGNGFVFNPGERVYGISTPGMALLLAGWLKIFPDHVRSGAILLNILATTWALIIVWKLLEGFSDQQRILCLFILIWSDKLQLRFLEGMETSLVVSCMVTALYFMIKEKPIPAGLAAGVMLWFRLDTGLLIVAIAAICFFYWRWNTVLFLLIAGVVYLPWMIFAQVYFGSVLPFTAIAKQVAYSINMAPWSERAKFLYSWMTPYTLSLDPIVAGVSSAVIYVVAGYGGWMYRQHVFVRVLALFFIIQTITLVALNMTVEQRYFVTSLYALLILFGLGLHDIFTPRQWKLAVFIAVYAGTAFYLMIPRLEHWRDYQRYIYDGTLKQMGEWLYTNSPENAVVFLEPLGYVGYYSQRKMFDEVGLITPVIVPLKRLGLNTFQIAAPAQPDYIIFHCDDAERAPEDFNYSLLVRWDPLGFEEGSETENWIVQRNACYEIHGK